MRCLTTLPRDLGDLVVEFDRFLDDDVEQIVLTSVKLAGIEILPAISPESVASIIEDVATPIIVSTPNSRAQLLEALRGLEKARA